MDYIFSGRLDRERSSQVVKYGPEVEHVDLIETSEDPDLAAAMRNSLQDIRGGDQQPQEYGHWIEDTLEVDPLQDTTSQDWGIIDDEQDDEQEYTDPPAVARQRQTSGLYPSGLRPSTSSLQVSSFLYCLMAVIPTLVKSHSTLCSAIGLDDYGEPSEGWWKNGALARDPRNLPPIYTRNQVQSQHGENVDLVTSKNLLASIHRVLGFIEGTKRAYGSCDDVIYQCLQWHAFYADDDGDLTDIGTLLKYFTDALRLVGGDDASSPFVSTAVQESVDGRREQEVFHINVNVERALCQGDAAATLDDAMDRIIWSTDDTVYMPLVSDVFCMTLRREDGQAGVGVTLPRLWYTQRFSQEAVEVVAAAKRQRSEYQREIRTLELKLETLETHEGKAVAPILDMASLYLRRIEGYVSSQPVLNPNDLIALDDGTNLRPTSDVAASLEDIKSSMLDKAQNLMQEREKACKEQEDCFRRLHGAHDTHDGHVLAGVALSATTYFVLRRNAAVRPGISFQLDDYEWWNIAFTVDNFSIHPCSFNEMIQIIHQYTASDGVFLIYARMSSMIGDPALVNDAVKVSILFG